ncbi:MAG: exodeoxyribonuclease VII large subunit [Limnochordaceae bacterium]|nr:exodeoxyribonuclease VII large subunit [Limnochordaceae bacterium]
MWTVSQLTEKIRSRLATDLSLQQVAVAGEVTGFKAHSASGHLYFSLKDSASRIPCVMWRSHAQRLALRVQDGDQVVATGYVDVYPPGGAYQLYVQGLYPVGRGLLHARLQALYRRLASEGLFDPARKRPVPKWPKSVGVVTSLDGAALRDIRATFRRRSPATPLIVCPARVQGEGSVESVLSALQRITRFPGVDVVILARGGGAADDLWVFNDERLVRAVAASPVPVVCAIGHEIDVTLVELAADVRASTPTAAAELAGPDEAAAAGSLQQYRWRLDRAIRRHVGLSREQVERLARHRLLQQPQRWLATYRQQVDELRARADWQMRRRLEAPRLALARLGERLSATNPLQLLARGYALAENETTARRIRSVADASPGQRVRLWVADGSLGCEVRERSPGVPWGRAADPPGSAGAGPREGEAR